MSKQIVNVSPACAFPVWSLPPLKVTAVLSGSSAVFRATFRAVGTRSVSLDASVIQRSSVPKSRFWELAGCFATPVRYRLASSTSLPTRRRALNGHCQFAARHTGARPGPLPISHACWGLPIASLCLSAPKISDLDQLRAALRWVCSPWIESQNILHLESKRRPCVVSYTFGV